MGFFVSVVQTQKIFWPKRITNKMSSVMPFTFNVVEICAVTINEKPWLRTREMCRALEYANIIRAHCSQENITQKHQMSSVHAACTPINWPKDSQRYDIYTNEEGMYELLFSSQQPKAKAYKQNEERSSTSHLRKRCSTCPPWQSDSGYSIWKHGIASTKGCVSGPVAKMSRHHHSSEDTLCRSCERSR